MDHGHNQHNAYRQELQRRFPRAGYWFGMLDHHPEIHPVLDQLRLGQDFAAPQADAVPAHQQAQAAPQHNLVYPGYYNPGFAGLYAPYNVPAPGYYPVPAVPPLPEQAPPAHYRDRPAQEAAPLRAPTNMIDTRFVTLSIPRNTDVPGGTVTRVVLRLETNLPFDDFFSRVCAHMDLQPDEAVIGYKFAGDRVSDVPHRLSNAEELQIAMDKAVEKIRRARTRDVVMEIHNLRATTGKAKKAAASKVNKRKADSQHDENDEDATISATTQLRTLKERLFCSKHSAHCYINPITAEHKALNTKQLTLWAKEIRLNEATYDTPPFIKDFDHFKQNIKKARINSRRDSGAANVNIYVSPLGDVTHRIGNLSSDTISSPGASTRKALINHIPGPIVKYPTVVEVLRDLDDFMPLVDYPRYGDAFTRTGIIYANAVLSFDEAFFTDVIGMPQPVVQDFIDHATRLVIRATKGKDKAEISPDAKDDGESKFNFEALFN